MAEIETGTNSENDLTFDDQEYNPAVAPKKAKAWLNRLEESEHAFQHWNARCDNIDKLYASLERLSQFGSATYVGSTHTTGGYTRDKEYQMFWANCEVLKPSIYAKAPVPVVVPKFKDRRPIYQNASEVMERCAVVAFDLARINDLMLLVRDDVAVAGRGTAWCRYVSKKDNCEGSGSYATERVAIDYKDRRDFLHSISRNWSEVTWVAAASYLTREEARDRFSPHSGDAYQEAEYRVDKFAHRVGGADRRQRAKFWEIWCKSSKRVVWVAKGVENILDEDDPHLDLINFFPCPKPAYGVVQRSSLVPVPDVLQYKDQLDEVNLLTSRIHALSDALEVKGFYPAGGAEIADAVEQAIRIKTAGRVLVPVKNWAAFGGSSEVIIWLPIDMIAQTITTLVTLRKQVIDDIYQIMGLSDIMRGATDPSETLGAQELKTQYGSTRIRDKQTELVRFARDLVEITSEIITEKFDDTTIIAMSQTQLPTKRDMHQKIAQTQAQMQQVQQQMQQAMQNPQVQQMAQQNPQQAQQLQQQGQQLIQQGQQQIQSYQQAVTIEQVLAFLKDNRTKSFVLDIETDSTIQADENAEKQRRAEFIGMLSQLLPQLAQMIASQPMTAGFCGELLKFAVAPFRAGRSLDGSIDELVEQMKQQGQSGQQKPDPATQRAQFGVQAKQMEIEYRKQKDAQDAQLKQAEMASREKQNQDSIQSNERIEKAKLLTDQQQQEAEANRVNLQAMADREKHQQEMQKGAQQMEIEARKADTMQQAAQQKASHMAQAAEDRRASEQFKLRQVQMQPPHPRANGRM